MKYAAVLFDLDDTLADSYEVRLIAIKRVLSHAEISSPSAEELLQNLDGSPVEPILDRIGADHGVKFDLNANYQRILYTLPPGLIDLYPGIKSMLECLSSQGTKLGVVTSTPRLIQNVGQYSGVLPVLVGAGIAELFDAVIGYEDTTIHRPHPEPIQLALTKLVAAPEDSMVVGDLPADIEAGRAAGCRTCLVTWGALRDFTESANADLVAETPEQLLLLLTG